MFSKPTCRWLARTRITRMLCVLLVMSVVSVAVHADDRESLLARSPREVAQQLAAVYGHKLDQVAYIPALPLIAKLRLSELTEDDSYRVEVTRVVAPFLS